MRKTHYYDSKEGKIPCGADSGKKKLDKKLMRRLRCTGRAQHVTCATCLARMTK